MIIQRYVDTYVGMYDFAVSGGAVGSIDLQIPVPINFIVREFFVIPIGNPLGGAGARISFDAIKTDVSPNVTLVGAFIPATLLASFITIVYGIFPGGAGVQSPAKFVNCISIGMSISVNPLTAGKIQVVLSGNGFDF
jgi:hypothetical protein